MNEQLNSTRRSYPRLQTPKINNAKREDEFYALLKDEVNAETETGQPNCRPL